MPYADTLRKRVPFSRRVAARSTSTLQPSTVPLNHRVAPFAALRGERSNSRRSTGVSWESATSSGD